MSEASETRVESLLAELRDAPSPPSTELAVRVVRTARWQRPVRSALGVVAGLGGAVASAAALLLGRRRT